MEKTCKCGNKFYTYSTVQSICPNCQFKKASSGGKKRGYFKQSWNDWGKSTTNGVKGVTGAKKKPKKKSEKELAKDYAWRQVSKYVRLLYSMNGVCVCYTCDRLTSIKNCDAGHFLSRTYTPTRYHMDNIRPQCIKCNRFSQGKSFEFEQHLISDIGLDRVNDLKDLARTIGDDSIGHHRAVELEYKQKLNELQVEMGVYYWK